jgi:hypothetical protein
MGAGSYDDRAPPAPYVALASTLAPARSESQGYKPTPPEPPDRVLSSPNPDAPYAPMNPSGERIDNTPLREAFIRSGMSASALARAVGYPARHLPRGVSQQGTRVKRELGLTPTPAKRGCTPSMRLTVSYDTAVRYAAALGLDPVDIGV